MLDIAPRITAVITDMWNASSLRQGWELVVTATEEKYGVRLVALAREVYTAYKRSKGSEEALKELIKQHEPHQTATQNPQTPPQTSNQTAITTPEGPNSSTNQAPQPNIAPNSAPGSAPEGAPDEVVAHFERNRKLSDEQADSFKSKFSC